MARQGVAGRGRVSDASQMRRAVAERFGLTVAEAAVAEILLQGSSYEAAARRLGISRNTVHTHVKAIHRKAGVRKTLELVALFHEGPTKRP